MRTAWRLYAASWPVFSGAVLVLFLSWVLLELAVVALHAFGILPWAILHVAFLVVFAGMMVGFHRLALDAIDGRKPRLVGLFAEMERGPGLLVAALAYAVLVAVGVILLVVPGFYVAARLSLIGPVIAARPQSPLAALRGAYGLTRGRWWRAAGNLAIVVLLNVLGAALLGVGLLVALPVSILTATAFYRSITPAVVNTASRS